MERSRGRRPSEEAEPEQSGDARRGELAFDRSTPGPPRRTTANPTSAAQYSRLTVQDSADRLVVRCERRDSYQVAVTTDLAEELRSLLGNVKRDAGCQSVFLVADRAAAPVTEIVLSTVRECGIPLAGVARMHGRETEKSLETIDSLWRSLHRVGMLRKSLLIGIGGGVTCDVSGFVASTFMRGIPYLLVPTTVMAQVDAAIGGKVGVNLCDRKNLVGSFYHPIGVIADVSLLPRLPPRIWSAGFAEVVKIAAVGSPKLLDLIDGGNLRDDLPLLRSVVDLAVREKLQHLSADPYELTELRRLLNFGHCIGHAVEAEVGFRWLHGECVAVGMAVACRVGHRAGITSRSAAGRIEKLLQSLSLPVHVPPDQAAGVWQHLDRIRQVRNGLLNLVVPTEIGAAQVLDEWPPGVSWSDVR
jgi:3-dehydroquinate synthase